MTPGSPQPSLNHTIWLAEQRIAFIYLPKVACTSWKLFFATCLGLRLPEDYAAVHKFEQLPLPYVALMPQEKQASFLDGIQNKSIEVTTVLREPRERILSAYLDKIKLHHNPNSYFSLKVMPSVRAHAGLSGSECPTFEQFLCWIATSDSPHRYNDHWLSMSTLLGLNGLTPPAANWRVWTMQELDMAAAYFNKILKTSISFPNNESLTHRPSHSTADKLVTMLTPAAENWIQQLYASDLALYTLTCQTSR